MIVGGNPDFTNAPGHGDNDALFYDRQQAYVRSRAAPQARRVPPPSKLFTLAPLAPLLHVPGIARETQIDYSYPNCARLPQ